MSAPACDRFDLLRRRLSCFMGDAREGRDTVGGVTKRLSDFGEVAVVGGMLPDLLLKDSYAEFRSDVDLVVDAPDSSALRALLMKYGATKNRFGGYALSTEWKADVWLLGSTWARVQGHKQVSKIDDLLDTTFFNWDAVLYSISRKQVICREDYLVNLDNRHLDINLRANPNLVGNCVRTLRAAILWGAVVSPRLAQFATTIIQEVGSVTLVMAEKRSFHDCCVLNEVNIIEALETFSIAAESGMPSSPLRAAYRGIQPHLPMPMAAEAERGGKAMRIAGTFGKRAPAKRLANTEYQHLLLA